MAEKLEAPAAQKIVLGLFIATATAFTLIPFIRFLRHGTAFDYRTWFDAAQAVLQHRDIYPRSGTFAFMYPPTCAVALALPALFGNAVMILLLCLLNTVAWILCIWLSLMLTGERRYRWAFAVVSNLILIVFVWSSYHLGQPSLLLLALMLGAFTALWRDRQILAGALIAAAAAIKAFPILALIYLVYRRSWTATISLLIALCLLLFVVPLPVRGIAQTLADFEAWQHGMLRYQSGGIAQRAGRGYSWKNQSVFGLVNRMLRPVSVNDEGEPVVYRNLADLPFNAINAIILLTGLALGSWFIAAMWKARNIDAQPFEFAALVILILFFTPLSYGYLYSWLMLPLILLTRSVLVAGSTLALSSIAIATVLLILTGLAPRQAQIYGSVFFAGLVLYFGVTGELWRAGRDAVSIGR
ncbi:MAG: DUF2029 domain-containing protein [Verrucomicrobia bacterium]|nr:DUF2029 domain-containing protein [Verrucomicrobiota bacterium]